MAARRDPKDKAPSRRSGSGASGAGNKRGPSSTPTQATGESRGAAKPFGVAGGPTSKAGAQSSRSSASGQRSAVQRAIPDAVANRMARRSAIASGVPTLIGMGVFVASYLLVSRDIAEIPPGATLVASGGCFLLGLVGLSYGVFSSSWENQPGSLLGSEQIRVNLDRLRESIRSMRQAGSGGSRD